jgi:hypothetical protein
VSRMRLAVALVYVGCAAPIEPCEVAAPTDCVEPAPSYATAIAPIISARCRECHEDGNTDGNWPLTEYSHVADWGDGVRASILDCSMPPPEAKSRMRNDERALVLQWIRCGMPR